ncbi:uncharacterized protein LOC141905591 isoform X2 [Tubulanus polymorphus]|uniref:uncharacterized protein LOC141905591 isoform X2 n=1 Tax=Tubulanus polymorphus TaxID=672921 RepID=UPI003DA63575
MPRDFVLIHLYMKFRRVMDLTRAQLRNRNNYFRGRFQVDRKKKNENEEDVGMVTAFQETQMLKSEVVLHEAARKNNVDVAKKLLSAKVNVNCTNNLDRTPLQWASANGHKEMTQLLLDHGADLECQDKYGMRPLLWAAWFGHLEVVKYLVSFGADTSVSNKQGLNLLQCASNQNRLAVVNFILESLENYSISDVDKKGRTALHLAANEGSMEVVEKLLESPRGCDINIKDKAGQTALHLAATNGHVDVVRKLLHTGMEIDDRDEEGRTACHLAAESGHAEVVDLLYLSNADPNAETLKEMTSLHIAAQNGHELVTRLIIEYGCNVNAQNFQGNTALHLASLANFPIIIRVLIDAGSDVDLPNHRLHTPLHSAVEKGHADAVEELLVSGANIESKEKGGRTALYMASRGSFIGIVDMIIKAERDRDFNSEDEDDQIVSDRIAEKKPVLENGGVDVTDGHLTVGQPMKSSTPNTSVPGTPIPGTPARGSPLPPGTPIKGSTPIPSTDDTRSGNHRNGNNHCSGTTGSISHDRDHVENPDSIDHNEQSGAPNDDAETSTLTQYTGTTTQTLENITDIGLDSSLEDHGDAVFEVTNRKQFKAFKHPYAEQMKTVLYKLASKQLKSGDWKKLAHNWKFTEEHIRAIMHQYTGESSYKEHGYRLLLIWLYGVKPDENPMKDLYQALCAIGRRNLAEQIRKKMEEESSTKSACVIS